MINPLMNGVAQAAQNRATARGGRGGQEGFDGFMANATDANNQQPREVSRPVQRQENAENSANDSQNQAGTTNEQRNDAPAHDESRENSDTQNIANETAPAECSAPAAEEADIADVCYEDELMAEMAAILGITVQELAQILEDLEMTLEDTILPENHAKLVVAAKGLEGHAELLNYPEALPILKEIAQTTEPYKAHVYANAEHAADEMNLEGELETVLEEITAGDISGQSTTQNRQTAETADTADATAAISQNAQVATEATQQNSAQADASSQMIINAAPAPQAAPVVADANVATPIHQSAPVTPQDIVQQVVQNVRLITGENMTEIRIKLNPDHLGELKMRIATHNGVVTAHFVAESQRVKELIEAGFTHLRDALEQAGINISDIEVNVNTGDANDGFDEEGEISDKRIRDIMAAAMESEEQENNEPLEENVIDYRV